MKTTLRLHTFLPLSYANGPGARAVIWMQGCSLACHGCYNPETHSFDSGQLHSPDDLFACLVTLSDGIEGITVTGGEPLQQMHPLSVLLERLRKETELSCLLFTGYTWTEIQGMPNAERLLTCVDVLIAGRYDESQRLARGLIGSANKTTHFLTDCYTMNDLKSVPSAEVIVTPQGEVILSGIDPIKL